ncbi:MULTISPECIES: peptidoglycan-binding protein [unclassified Streptomyces]|uniref:peptidoglycan-binding domain-containing protein n=1 Tax=unclassified Streptomyces TaxID=2593676 RepID=UPI003D8B512F
MQSFQPSRGLAADGIVGSATWRALAVAVQQGSAGPAVTALQRQLNAHGAALSVDGVFGSSTGGAVRTFQSAHGLPSDGVAAATTWQTLIACEAHGGVRSIALRAWPRCEAGRAATLIVL